MPSLVGMIINNSYMKSGKRVFHRRSTLYAVPDVSESSDKERV